MDIQHLRCFVEVARQGKIQAAADTLYVCRQAVSKTLSQLEDEIGEPLFQRSHNGIALNDRGARFLDRAESLVREFDALRTQMEESEVLCPIRISLPFTTHHFFWNQLGPFLAKNADWIALEAVNGLDTQCRALVESGNVDMGISILPFSLGTADGRLVASSPIQIAVHADHPLASRNTVDQADLVGLPLIFYMNGYEQLDWLDEGYPAPTYRVNDILAAFDLVLQGRGIFPVPELAVLGPLPGIVILPYTGPNDRDDFYCAISASAAKDKRKHRACLAIRDTLAKPLRNQSLLRGK